MFYVFFTVKTDSKFKALIKEVREDRKNHKTCLSAQDDVDMKALLKKIIEDQIFEEDYKKITQSLLFEKASYDVVIKSLESIATIF